MYIRIVSVVHMTDGAHEVQPIDRNKKRKSYVSIISHEGDSVPFESTNADTLTQFFTDYNNIRVGVRSYIVDGQVRGYINLVNVPNYSKVLCDVKGLCDVIRSQVDVNEPSPVTFLFCHGCRRGKYPASLNFGEERFKHDVWARRKDSPERGTILQDLIYKSKLVLMMCCNGDQILQDYLVEQGNDIPDILMYNCGNVSKTSVAIFMALLMNLIDSDDRIVTDPCEDNVYFVVRDSIITILKIVKWCSDDKDQFWELLFDMGCISPYESEKRKQGLPIPMRRQPGYEWLCRVFGHMYNDLMIDDNYDQVFNDFKALTLVSAGETEPLEQNYEVVDPLPSTLDKKLWEVLHDYVKSTSSEEALGAVDTSGDDKQKTPENKQSVKLLCNLLRQLQNLST